MENNNEKKFTEATYTVSSGNSKSEKNPKFFNSVLMPFCSSALATVLVIGVCFGVPSIRGKFLNNTSNSNGNVSITSGAVSKTVTTTDYSNTAISVANKVLPSIVGISVEYTVNSFFGQSSTAQASGSGIIISEDGYILTNNHVINSTSSNSFYQLSEANNLKVKLYNDETEYDAKVIGSDAQTDLAVIKIEKTGLTAAELGDSDAVQVGEFAMAVGNPLGLQSSISCGIISAKNREVPDTDTGTTYKAIQTDAAINSGNSGGALVNADGKVIGINTLKLAGDGIEGIGFAIPINSTIDVYKELISKGKISRPYIGITGIDLDEKTAKKNNLVEGIYVRSVENFSSAEKGGIQAGDVIIEAEGTKIKTMDELNTIKNKHAVGDKLKLKVIRDGKEKEITLTLQEQ